MRDVRLRVELPASEDATFDLAAIQRRDDRGNAKQKIVLRLFVVQALLKLPEERAADRLQDLSSPFRHLVAENDADLVHLLPVRVQREKPTDFKIPRRDIQLR